MPMAQNEQEKRTPNVREGNGSRSPERRPRFGMWVYFAIIFFLVVEPAGLARLWQIGKEKLRRWPFPY